MSEIFNLFDEECALLHLKADAGIGEVDMLLDQILGDNNVMMETSSM